MPTVKLSEKCGRCPREDLVEVSIDEAVNRLKSPTPKQQALEIVLDGVVLVRYDYLCEDCRGIVAGYCHGTAKQKKKSARRFKRVEMGQARPAQSARR